MKITVICPQYFADQSQRKTEEEVEVDISDTIENVKLKTTLIYTMLDTEKFYFTMGERKLRDEEKVTDLLKVSSGPHLLLRINLDSGCCRLF